MTASPIYDIHTHDPEAPSTSIICAAPGDTLRPDRLYSVGVHPWDITGAVDIDVLAAACAQPQVVAVGETGLDGSIAVDRALQQAALEAHARVSRELHKPLVLHIVRGWADIIALHQAMRPAEPWIVHGFRGKPELARQLLSEGFYLSYGDRFNPQSLALTPPERRLMETDASPLPIHAVASLQSSSLIDASPILLPN